MIGASKILTVSYGTFSCTLEGFDDPFNTMKAIAEYFRDLAAEDRYFGAEPPQPDAAMLHRIAEREIQRRVEAKIQDNGVILRAEDGVRSFAPAQTVAQPAVQAPVQPAVEAPVAAAPAVAAVIAEPVVEAAPTDVVAFEEAAVEAAVAEDVAPEVVVPDVVAEPQDEITADAAGFDADFGGDLAAMDAPVEEVPEAPAVAAAIPEGVAAKLARLRQAVGTVSVAKVEVLPPSEHFEDEHATSLVSDAAVAAETAMVFDDADVAEMDAVADEEDIAEMAALDGADEADLAATEDATSADADVMERLDDLLADELPEAEVDDVPEDFAEEAGDAGDDLAGLIATIAGGTEETVVEAEAAAEVEAEDAALDPFADDPELDDEDDIFALTEAAQDDVAEVAGDLNDDLPDELTALDAEEAPVEVEAVAEVEAPVEAEVETEVEVEAEAEVEAPVEAAAEPVAEAAHDVEAEAAPAPDHAETAAVTIAEKIQRARARVIKIRRSDAAPAAEAVPATGEVDERSDADKEEDMARLMRQADDEMSGPENQRRLSAIQHLKAAVAATVAERRAGVTQPSEEERADPYRADLARAVVPVRPRPAEGRPVRPAARPVAVPQTDAPSTGHGPANDGPVSERPAPLVLVSSQRIDRAPMTANPAPVSPVRPRRVGSAAPMSLAPSAMAMDEDEDDAMEADLRAALETGTAEAADDAEGDDDTGMGAPNTENIFADSRGFDEFAERLGATELPDLLEAAAAYAICVENRDHFTRPLLMRRLEAGQLGEKISREEGLIGFGTLLREGRIEKVRRGHYALTDRSSYLAEARKITQ